MKIENDSGPVKFTLQSRRKGIHDDMVASGDSVVSTFLSNVINRFLPAWMADLIGDNSSENVICQKCGRKNCNFLDPGPSFLRREQTYVNYHPNSLEAQYSQIPYVGPNHQFPEHTSAPETKRYNPVLSFGRKRIFPETFWEREMRLFRADRSYPDASTVNRQQPIIYFPRGSLLKPKYLRPPPIVPIESSEPYLPETSMQNRLLNPSRMLQQTQHLS